MTPATWPRPRTSQRLLHIDPCSGRLEDLQFGDLLDLLDAGDVVVVNDAATLPASLQAGTTELRLARRLGPDRWQVVLFGAGDWRVDTDRRPAPEPVVPGQVLRVEPGTDLVVEEIDERTRRLVTVRVPGGEAAFWAAVYAAGRPVQYSYMTGDLALDAVQTPYPGRPWALEMPSAGRPLTAAFLTAVRSRGVTVARLTHAAGLSATGDPVIDALLPLPERYEIPAETAAAINGRSGRVIAVGTSVVRALETAADPGGVIVPGAGETDLVIEPGYTPRVVDALLSGMHEPGESHFRMHLAFAPEPILMDAWRHAVDAGYRNHEFGDSCVIL